MDCLSPIVNACVSNQSNNHWLFFDALESTITMCLKCWGKVRNPLALVNLINDDFGIVFELSYVKKEVCGVLESFLFV